MRYLAPLNYDRFFKKVFSHLDIAKQFLEDFLEIKIQTIQFLDKQHFLTDDSAKVEFDFRCTTADSEIIIDMQQWYKSDIVKRFYMYHSAGTVLQLETIKTKQIPLSDTEKKEITSKDYSQLKPIITLIWMVDDTLAYDESYVAFAMTPEQVRHFVSNKALWNNPDITILMEERTRILKIMENDTKELDFLSKNRLIFMFQPTLSNNPKLSTTIKRWFKFAQLTKNTDNQESDFEEYKKDPVFSKIIGLIAKSKLSKSDLNYIKSEEEKQQAIQLYFESETNSLIKEANRKEQKAIQAKEEAEKQKEEAEKQREEAEKQREESEKQKKEAERLKEDAEKQREEERQEKVNAIQKMVETVKRLKAKGMSCSEIAEITGMPENEIETI
jgi:flagellar biosynthesis GTPase FlhF